MRLLSPPTAAALDLLVHVASHDLKAQFGADRFDVLFHSQDQVQQRQVFLQRGRFRRFDAGLRQQVVVCLLHAFGVFGLVVLSPPSLSARRPNHQPHFQLRGGHSHSIPPSLFSAAVLLIVDFLFAAQLSFCRRPGNRWTKKMDQIGFRSQQGKTERSANSDLYQPGQVAGKCPFPKETGILFSRPARTKTGAPAAIRTRDPLLRRHVRPVCGPLFTGIFCVFPKKVKRCGALHPTCGGEVVD